MRKLLLLIAIVMISATACTDAEISALGALGEPGHIKCYSGGLLIYEGSSTGKIATVTNSDGWEFKDAATGHFIRVSGDCLIVN